MTGNTTGGNKPRVVIIDDEPETVSVLTTFFDMFGFEPFGAYTGSAGMKAIAEHRPQVVILDLMLPDADGFELCRQLREQPETKDLPIIILSARTGREDVRRGYAVGASRYLKKPVDLDLLINEARRMVAAVTHMPPSPEIQEADARSRSNR